MTVEERQEQSESTNLMSGEAFAWKVHAALQDWTGKVDTKASIVLTLEIAVLSTTVAFATPSVWTYSSLWLWWLHRAGLVLLFLSVVLAGAVVYPQLRRREAARSWHSQLIYFGHLRLWQPVTLAYTLAVGNSARNLLTLSTQIVTMSRIAWLKHILIQWSLLVALVGCLAVGIPLAVSG